MFENENNTVITQNLSEYTKAHHLKLEIKLDTISATALQIDYCFVCFVLTLTVLSGTP